MRLSIPVPRIPILSVFALFVSIPSNCNIFAITSPAPSLFITVTQIRGHIAGTPPLPTEVRAFVFIARRAQHVTPFAHSRRICFTMFQQLLTVWFASGIAGNLSCNLQRQSTCGGWFLFVFQGTRYRSTRRQRLGRRGERG